MPEDRNGFEIKGGHRQRASLPFGESVYVLRREDDKIYGVWKTERAAAHASGRIPNSQPEWYEVVEVPVGSIRILDLVPFEV